MDDFIVPDGQNGEDAMHQWERVLLVIMDLTEGTRTVTTDQLTNHSEVGTIIRRSKRHLITDLRDKGYLVQDDKHATYRLTREGITAAEAMRLV